MAADLASRVPTYQNALSKLELSTNNLKMLLGLDEATELELSSTFKNDFSETTLADMPNTDLKLVAPELKNLAELVKLNEKAAHLKSKSSTPTLAAFGAWNFVGASKYKTIGGADRFQSVSAIGLSLQIPIDIGGSTQAQHEEAIQDYYQSKLQLILTEKKSNLDLHNATDEFKGLLVTYKANLEAVRLAHSSLILTRSMFESGKLSLSDLNQAEQLLTMQKFQQEATLFSINAVFARIEKWTAKDLGSY
jgi:outer membrane protein TolC